MGVLTRLQKLHPKKIDLSLDRSRKLLKKLGSPEEKINNAVVIAGTNGKGSTTTTLKSILEAHGKTVSSYISPHLVKINERIIIGQNEIDDDFIKNKGMSGILTNIIKDKFFYNKYLLHVNIYEFKFTTS